jgi:plasmid stabilization system protein ParE
MKNIYKLIWSDEALENLKNIIAYLENHWTSREISKFVKLLDKKMDLIKANPHQFPKSERYGTYRKSVLTKHTTIYYEINDFEVNIISLFDNRRNPNRLLKK